MGAQGIKMYDSLLMKYMYLFAGTNTKRRFYLNSDIGLKLQEYSAQSSHKST